MPWSDARTKPGSSRTAPENAPFTWPKSWPSTSVSGIAPQFTATKLAGALRDGVHRAREHLLARARLAEEEQRQLGRHHLAELAERACVVR